MAGITIFTGYRVITAIQETLTAAMVEPITAIMSYGLSEVNRLWTPPPSAPDAWEHVVEIEKGVFNLTRNVK